MNKMKVDLFCIASGPSLTKEDCELIESTGIRVLAVNNSYEQFSRCDFLFAGDLKWWNAYKEKVPAKIQKWTSSKKAAFKHGLHFFPATGAFNSGMRSLMWALHNGFKNIVLLGFDCSLKNGVHWHGLHDRKLGLSNPDQAKVNKWETQFLDVYKKSARFDAKIINCSRYTELNCFPYMSLESVLGLKEKNREIKKEGSESFKDLTKIEAKVKVEKKKVTTKKKEEKK